MSEITAN